MKYNESVRDSLVLVDFDIKGLFKVFPQIEIAVRINAIYSQIAKFTNNPLRNDEMRIFMDTLKKAQTDKNRRCKYTVMKLEDVVKCFGDDLKKMPIGSFAQSTPIEKYCTITDSKSGNVE